LGFLALIYRAFRVYHTF